MSIEITKGNVFDAILPPDEAILVKIRAELLSKIMDFAEERELTQHQLSKLLDVTQSRVSDLMTGKLHKFSLGMLVKLTARLGMTIELKVKKVA